MPDPGLVALVVSRLDFTAGGRAICIYKTDHLPADNPLKTAAERRALVGPGHANAPAVHLFYMVAFESQFLCFRPVK